MSYDLPREAQKSRKYNSLPDDLKSIADDLLRDKFKIEKEATPDQGGTFRADYEDLQWDGRGPYGPRVESYMGGRYSFNNRGYRNEIRVSMDYSTRSQVAEVAVDEPSLDILMQAMHRFDKENLRGPRTFVMGPKFFDALRMGNREIEQYFRSYHRRYSEGGKQVIGELFGCEIEISDHPNDTRFCILRARM